MILSFSNTLLFIFKFYLEMTDNLNRCGPCKAIAPLITQLEIKLTDEGNPYKGKVSFIKVDVDSSTTLARKMNIAAMPTFLIYSKGKVAKTIVGANFNAIQDFLQDLLQKGESKQPEEKEELHKEEAEEEVTSI